MKVQAQEAAKESGAFRRDVSRSCDAVYSEVPAPFTALSLGTRTTARPLQMHGGLLAFSRGEHPSV